MTIKSNFVLAPSSMVFFAQSNWQGLAVALVIATAATFLSEHYGAPTILFALLLGLALNFLSEQPSLKPGLTFSAKTVLRLGVGLLGIQLGLSLIHI